MYLVCLLIFLLILFSIVYYTLILGISPMPTSTKVKKALLDHLPPNITGNIYELGSGWGHIAYLLAKKYPSAKVIAFELSPVPYLFSKIYTLFQPNITICRLNFLKTNMLNPSLVYCYLFPGGMKKLAKLPLTTTLVSNTFRLPNVTPHKVITVDDLHRTQVYFYNHNTTL